MTTITAQTPRPPFKTWLWRYLGWPNIEFKFYLAFTNWVFIDFTARLILMISVTSLWRAVYTETQSINGVTVDQAVNYMLLANLFGGFVFASVIYNIGWIIRSGEIIMEMLRPVDIQLQQFIRTISNNFIGLLFGLPIAFCAIVFFGLKLPGDPAIWLAFTVAIVLGQAVIFLFDWIIVSLLFYTQEVWGISVMRSGIALFLGGFIVPYAIMPDWLRSIASLFPFQQAGAIPIGILAGSTPLSDVPRVWLTQLLWIAVLFVVSRWTFAVASRKVTVQGG